MKIFEITPHLRPQYQKQLAALEKTASYPLGEDRFKIDHGDDYFSFFDRLGKLTYFAAEENGQIAAVGAGVLRSKPLRTWYLCDLKVHPDFRGRHLPIQMLKKAFFFKLSPLPARLYDLDEPERRLS